MLRHSTSFLADLSSFFSPHCVKAQRHCLVVSFALLFVCLTVLRHSGFVLLGLSLALTFVSLGVKTKRCLATMSFARSLHDRIIDLSDVFANHFNNLLALDFQEETTQLGQDENEGQWRQVERSRRSRWVPLSPKSEFNPLPLPQVEQP